MTPAMTTKKPTSSHDVKPRSLSHLGAANRTSRSDTIRPSRSTRRPYAVGGSSAPVRAPASPGWHDSSGRPGFERVVGQLAHRPAQQRARDDVARVVDPGMDARVGDE